MQYPKTKAPPVVTIKCSNTKDRKQIQEEDKRLYEKLKHQTKPLTGTDIPGTRPGPSPQWAEGRVAPQEEHSARQKLSGGYHFSAEWLE